MIRIRVLVAFVFSLVAAGRGLCADHPTALRETLRTIAEASVYVRAERVFNYEHLPSSGSGFFINQEGYVLTNWHVVADQMKGYLWGQEREIKAKVLDLAVVVHSGTPEERELPAKIVARDRDKDLALLHVDYRPEAFIDVFALGQVEVGDELWLAGFPFGELLAWDRKANQNDEPNPSVSVNSGHVTSLRRTTAGDLAKIQLDASVNPGNSGGPIVNRDGELIGVVFASVIGGEGLGFGLPPNVIREFVDQQAVRITFHPGAVLSPPSPIEVEVEPLLVAPGQLTGEVRFEGDDIASVTVPLRTVPTGLSGTIDVPDRVAGLARPERYFVTVSLTSAGNSKPVVRRFALDAVPESFQTLTSEREPSRMMEDRKLPTDEMAIEDYAKGQPVAAGEGHRSALADAARNIKLQRDSSGAVVLDNQAVKQIAGPRFDPKRYALLPDDGLRALAERFDRLNEECQQVQAELVHLRDTPEYWKLEMEIGRSMSEARRQRSAVARQLQERGVAVCTDDPLYFVGSSYEFARDYPCVNYKWIQ